MSAQRPDNGGRQKNLEAEKAAFDQQIGERLAHGFVPDLRRLQKVDWLYNNVWRDPKLVEIHWLPRIQEIIEQACQAGRDVLEIGCGPGMLSLELARNGLRVTGVDLSEQCIAIARQYRDENPYPEGFGSLDYRCGDVLEMSFTPDSFDAVIFFRSLHHFDRPKAVVRQVFEALRKGGRILLSEPVRGHFTAQSARVAAVLRTILPTWQPLAEKLAGPWTAARWEKEVQRIFEEYARHGDHEQSPLDNSLDRAEDFLELIEEKFQVEKVCYGDAFMDKLIGGLRGEHKYELARFLSFLDWYLVDQSLLPPTSMELVATKI